MIIHPWRPTPGSLPVDLVVDAHTPHAERATSQAEPNTPARKRGRHKWRPGDPEEWKPRAKPLTGNGSESNGG